MHVCACILLLLHTQGSGKPTVGWGGGGFFGHARKKLGVVYLIKGVCCLWKIEPIPFWKILNHHPRYNGSSEEVLSKQANKRGPGEYCTES